MAVQNGELLGFAGVDFASLNAQYAANTTDIEKRLGALEQTLAVYRGDIASAPTQQYEHAAPADLAQAQARRDIFGRRGSAHSLRRLAQPAILSIIR